MLTNDFNKRNIKESTIENYNPFLIEQCIAEVLLEAISKEQKEKGQREMEKINIQPFVRLNNYLNNKWNNKKLNKEERIQKKIEFSRFDWLLEYAKNLAYHSDAEATKYLKNTTGNYPQWLTLKGEKESAFKQLYDNSTFLELGEPDLSRSTYGVDIVFNTDKEDIKKILKKYIILHEYGHLYDFLQKAVETGEFPSIVDTKTGATKDVVDSEGKANAYAIDNIYRKDRRELIKNSDLTKDKLEKAKTKLNNVHKLSDEYLAGTEKHSKTVKRVLDSIEKEKQYFKY